MPSIHQNTAGNLTVKIWFWYQLSHRISGSIEGTTLKITKFMPHIMTTVVPNRYWWGNFLVQMLPQKPIYQPRGFLGYLPSFARELLEIDINIRFIVHVWFKGYAVFELPSQPKPWQDNSAPTEYAEVGTNMWKNSVSGGLPCLYTFFFYTTLFRSCEKILSQVGLKPTTSCL